MGTEEEKKNMKLREAGTKSNEKMTKTPKKATKHEALRQYQKEVFIDHSISKNKAIVESNGIIIMQSSPLVHQYPSVAELQKQDFGRASKNHSFMQTVYFETTLILILK